MMCTGLTCGDDGGALHTPAESTSSPPLPLPRSNLLLLGLVREPMALKTPMVLIGVSVNQLVPPTLPPVRC